MSAIGKGDLVMIVRNHCGDGRYMGIPFRVLDVGLSNARCASCGELTLSMPFAELAIGGEVDVGAPLSYLIKIEPLADPENVEHTKELTA